MKVVVEFGEWFGKSWKRFPQDDQEKIKKFIFNVERGNILEGVNKSSDDVPKDDPEFRKKVRYARYTRLWHYHIGVPEYYDENKPNGYKTSSFLLHYQKCDGRIKIVDYSKHPPFELFKILTK